MSESKHGVIMGPLLVIISDRLSELVDKGEINDRYYNPGGLFKEVHILMTNDDTVDPSLLQRSVGEAKLYLYNLPAGMRLCLSSFGWQTFLLQKWIEKGIFIAKAIRPSLVRTHNNFLQGYMAKEIKDALGIPYIISLHGVWDRDNAAGFRRKSMKLCMKKLEKASLENADAVIAVYRSVLRYAKEYGAKDIRLIYNVVAGEKIEKKQEYRIMEKPKLITINRQLKEKNPENIIRAIKDIDCHYVIIGDGSYHGYLKRLAISLHCESKVEFIEALPNDKICSMLKDFDFMVSHCDYKGISKTSIEAALAGLPIILNKHMPGEVPELDGGWAMLCDNTEEGYRSAISIFIKNDAVRHEYGIRAYQYARENFLSEVMERRTVGLYKEIMLNGQINDLNQG